MVPFGTLCRTAWGIRHIHFSRLKVEFRNTDFKSPEQTVPLSGKTVKFNKTQRRLVLPTFPVIPKDMGTGSPTGIHISVISRCKSVVRLYQQSAIRSKRKIGLRQVRRKFHTRGQQKRPARRRAF
ncbi:conserved hypothetical protein [Agrobacterium deltaense Zutra 3/1]|uniref:Uncharacterized protein n=1 Tax=Agrobacterium deltaense Zutra 3/1 TaxID=1183427 RepID=A0A1S7PMA1_9HYPH|nr:conserved hypothetical protein [Agrobacterium deltaense Zutra 3/1]